MQRHCDDVTLFYKYTSMYYDGARARSLVVNRALTWASAEIDIVISRIITTLALFTVGKKNPLWHLRHNDRGRTCEWIPRWRQMSTAFRKRNGTVAAYLILSLLLLAKSWRSRQTNERQKKKICRLYRRVNNACNTILGKRRPSHDQNEISPGDCPKSQS